MIGSCDWGGHGHGWLPVCDSHTRTIDEDDPTAPIRLAPLPEP